MTRLARCAFAFCALGVAGSLLVIACDQGPVGTLDIYACERAYSVCPNVRPLGSQDYTDCARALDGPCGTTARQYIQCITGKCDDAGTVDRGVNQCVLIFNAYQTCVAAQPASAGDAGGGTRDPLPPLNPTSDAGFAADAGFAPDAF